jgi:prophage antirepressor-like protein
MPIFELNGIRYLSLKAIGEVLYPASPKNIYKIYRNSEHLLSKNVTVFAVDTVTGTRETIFLNLKGVTHIIMKCNQSKYAEKFQEWAVDHLANIIETGFTVESSLVAQEPLYLAEQINKSVSLVIESTKRTNERLDLQDNKLEKLESKNEVVEQALRVTNIDRFQRRAIQNRINIIVSCIAEENNLDKKHIYPKVWYWFKDLYNVPSYEDLPKSLFHDAIEILNSKIIEQDGIIPSDNY